MIAEVLSTVRHRHTIATEPRTGLAARNEAYFAQLRRQADEDAAQKAQAEARLDDDERARLEQQRQERQRHEADKRKHLQQFANSFAVPKTKAILRRRKRMSVGAAPEQ
uniref:Uncharacterized protein n=1 Tax=Pinguiococcus pyrenoidosus TaxID=172671 RepID=A0A7R9UEW1_9STRA|mmetsp:Transcript_7983/g.29862  ORF Transcript_7983/g.29862 Transcript_7983/m.29862 type:complete len:109 (+) Transcript_7983:131-457(+)